MFQWVWLSANNFPVEYNFFVFLNNNLIIIVLPSHVRNSPYTIRNLKNVFFRSSPPTRLLQFSNGTLLISTVTRDKFISRTHLFSVTHFYTMTWLMVYILFFFGMVFDPVLLLMPHQIHTDLWFHYENAQIIVSSICTHY